MAGETLTRNLRDATMLVQDDGAANYVTAVLEEGNLTLVITQQEIIQILDRGDLSHMRPGDEVPVEVTFGLKFCEFVVTTGGDPTLYECFHHVGEASAWVSTNTDGGDVFTLDVVFIITNPASGGKNEQIVLSRVPVGVWNFTEGDEYNTLSYSGIAFMTLPTITRVDASS